MPLVQYRTQASSLSTRRILQHELVAQPYLGIRFWSSPFLIKESPGLSVLARMVYSEG